MKTRIEFRKDDVSGDIMKIKKGKGKVDEKWERRSVKD